MKVGIEKILKVLSAITTALIASAEVLKQANTYLELRKDSAKKESCETIADKNSNENND